MPTETVEELAGYVLIETPYPEVNGLYSFDMAYRLARNITEETADGGYREATRQWASALALQIRRCAERAEAVEAELCAYGYDRRFADKECGSN